MSNPEEQPQNIEMQAKQEPPKEEAAPKEEPVKEEAINPQTQEPGKQLKPHDIKFQILRAYVFANVLILYPFVFFNRTCPTIVTEDIAESYGVKKKKIGVFTALFFYPYAILQLFAGLLADILDPALLVAAAQLVAAVGAVICGASNSLALGSFGRFLVGLGCGPSYVPICKFCSVWFPLKYYSVFLGIVAIVGNLGGIIASFPLVEFCETYHWRTAFYGIAGLGAFLSITCLIFCRGTPEDKGYEPVNPSVKKAQGTPLEKLKQLGRNFIEVSKSKEFWIVGIYIFLKEGPYFDVSGLWAGPFLFDVHNMTKHQKSITCLGLTLGSLCGGLFLPTLTKLFKTKKWIIVVMTTLYTVAFLILSIKGDDEEFGRARDYKEIPIHESDYDDDGYLDPKRVPTHYGNLYPLLYIIYLIIGMGSSGCVPVHNGLLREYFDPSIAGTSIGIGNFLGFIASAVYQNISSAIIPGPGTNPLRTSADKEFYLFKGYRNGLWIFCLVSAALALVFIVLAKDSNLSENKEGEGKENLPQKQEQEEQKQEQENAEKPVEIKENLDDQKSANQMIGNPETVEVKQA